MFSLQEEQGLSANQLKRLRKKRAREEKRVMQASAAEAAAHDAHKMGPQRLADLRNLKEMYNGVVAEDVVEMVFENNQYSFEAAMTLLCEMAEQKTEERPLTSPQWKEIPPEVLTPSHSSLDSRPEPSTGGDAAPAADKVEGLKNEEREVRGKLWASGGDSTGARGRIGDEEWEEWEEAECGSGSVVETFVRGMFSGLEPGLVSDMLRESNEDVEAAVENLLRASQVMDDETMSLQSVEDRLFGRDSVCGSSSSDEEEDDEEGDYELYDNDSPADRDAGHDDELWQKWPEDLDWETLDVIAQQQEELEKYMLDQYLLQEETRQLRTSNVLLKTNQLAQLQDMFPQERRSTLLEYLNAEGGDMERVVALLQSAPPSQQEKVLKKKLKKLRREGKRGKIVNVRDLHTVSSSQLSSAWGGSDAKERTDAIQGYHSAPSLEDLRRSADDNFPSLTSSPPPSLAWTGQQATARGATKRKAVPPPSYPMDDVSKMKYEHLVRSYPWLDEGLLEELFIVNDKSLTRTTTALSELYSTHAMTERQPATPEKKGRRSQMPSAWKERKTGKRVLLPPQEEELSQWATADEEENGEEERVPYCGPAEKNTRVPRVYEKVKKVPKDFQPVMTRGSKKRQRTNNKAKQAAIISGSARAGTEYRGQAMRHAQLRNEYYRNAAKAFVNGDGKLAKELSQKARLMETNNDLAADHFFHSKNYVVQGMQHVDLHGLHLQEALNRVHALIARYENMDKSGRPVGIHIVTGEGNHSQGGKPVIKPGLVQYLAKNHIRFRQHSGVVVVYL